MNEEGSTSTIEWWNSWGFVTNNEISQAKDLFSEADWQQCLWRSQFGSHGWFNWVYGREGKANNFYWTSLICLIGIQRATHAACAYCCCLWRKESLFQLRGCREGGINMVDKGRARLMHRQPRYVPRAQRLGEEGYLLFVFTNADLHANWKMFTWVSCVAIWHMGCNTTQVSELFFCSHTDPHQWKSGQR